MCQSDGHGRQQTQTDTGLAALSNARISTPKGTATNNND